MVEPDVAQLHLGQLIAQGSGGSATQPDRRIADPDDAIPKVRAHRLGDHPGGIGEVDDPRVGGDAAYGLGDLEGNGHGSQAVGDPAWSGRLLAEQVQVERDPFVGDPPSQPADPDGDEDKVRALQRKVERGRRRHRRRLRFAVAQVGEDGGDARQPVGVDIVEGDSIDPVDPGVSEQRPVDQRHPETAAAEDHKFHVPTMPTPGTIGRSGRDTAAPRQAAVAATTATPASARRP